MNNVTNFFRPKKSLFYPVQGLSVTDKIKITTLGSILTGSLFAAWEHEIEQLPAHLNPFLLALIRYIFKSSATLTINNLLINSLYGTIKPMDIIEQTVVCLAINLLGLALLPFRETTEILYKLFQFLLPLLFFIVVNPNFLRLLNEGSMVDALQTLLLPLLGMALNEIYFRIGNRHGQQLLSLFFREEQAALNEADNQNLNLPMPYLAKYTIG